MTKHYKQILLPGPVIAQGQLMVHDHQWYLVHNDEVARLPLYVYLSLAGKHVKTAHWGPYIFYNNFESTAEAHYLKKMFQYPQLTSTPEIKVRGILKQYCDWISVDTEFVQALIEREGCPNYWNKPRCSPQMIAEADCDYDPNCHKCWTDAGKVPPTGGVV